MHYKVIVASYDCMDRLPDCLLSIQEQNHHNFQVCVIDDASPGRQAEFIADWCEKRGWKYILNDVNRGALYNQIHGIRLLEPSDDDVIVFIDGDDKLAHPDVFNTLDLHYAKGVMMTYGSYDTDPHSETCPVVDPYPQRCILDNDYRNAYKWGIHFNHLRTVKYRLISLLDDDVDFKDGNGEWYRVAGDTAVMIPCLEMANGNYAYIPEILYVYSSDNPLSDWRTKGTEINRIHHRIFT